MFCAQRFFSRPHKAAKANLIRPAGQKIIQAAFLKKWCPGADLNRKPID
jgi:hypothetical protein